MSQAEDKFFTGDFWRTENRRYSEPHFRLEKCARLVNRLAAGRPRELLDVGCGPAALEPLLDSRIRYQGVDIAIQHPKSNLLELDFVTHDLPFAQGSFDIVVASGVFEYMGRAQARKFGEIAGLLKRDGTFVVSYINFDHARRVVSPFYNNVQSIPAFRQGLDEHFQVVKAYPNSYNWQGTPPRRKLLKRLEMPLNFRVPFADHLAVEYFFLCAPK